MKLLLVSLSLIILGCRGPTGPAGPPGGPVLTGNIRGTVILYSELSRYFPLEDSSGVTIALHPASHSTISQADGSWELTGVPTGIYTLKFSKPGYFTNNRYNFQFVGGGTYYYYPVVLQEVPSLRIQQFSMTFLDTTRILAFSGALQSPDSVYRQMLILLSKTVINTTLPFEFDAVAFAYVPKDSVNFSRNYYIYPYSTLSGSTLRAVALVNALYSWYPQINPETRRYHFDTPGVSFSEQQTAFIP